MKREKTVGGGGHDAFVARVDAHRRAWRAGLGVRLALRLAGLALVGLTAFGLLDRFLAIPADARRWINAVGLTALAVLAARELARISRVSAHETARRIDRLRADRRRPVLTAYELLRDRERAADEDGGLNAFLVARSVAHADQFLAGVPWTRSVPWGSLRRQSRILGVQSAALALSIALNTQAARAIFMRIVRPGADAPPYSRFVFDIEPAAPRVAYGGHAELTVRITGEPVKAPVWMLTRDGRRIHRTACFQEAPDRFAQRLENVVAPIDFCFATGKARSAWRAVEVLLQPRIALASVVLTPPPYSGLPQERFYAGGKPLQGLRGSVVQLTLTSNRPLLDGEATVQPRHATASERTVPGRRLDTHSVAFQWTLDGPADVTAVLRDIQGTSTEAPFRMTQQEVADAPPSVAIHEPPSFSLATPRIGLDLRGETADDLGLRRVELVQALVGFRDRIRRLGPDEPVRRFPIERRIELGRLGVEPGDILEFYVEAQDTHPGMAGISASGIARIQIVSEEEYASMLRAKVTLQEFLARYQATEAAIRRLREDLDALADAAATAGDKDARLADAVQSAKEAFDMLSRLAGDFAVFDIERRMLDGLGAIAETVGDALKELQLTTAANPRLDALARHWRDALTPAMRTLTAQREQAAELARIAGLMEAAVRFKLLVQQQESLVRSLARYETDPVADGGRRLRTLGTRQADIRRELAQIVDTIKREAPELPPSAAEFGASALRFAETLEASGAEGFMAAAVVAADNTDGRLTHRQASLALERMKQSEQDCKDDEGFGAMCGGQGPPRLGEGEVQSTIEQMLAAMTMRLMGGRGGEGPTPSQGIGSRGLGLGGDADDGFWMAGHTPLNIPMFGPARWRFDAASFGAAGDAGQGGHASPASTTAGSVPIEIEPGTTVDSRSMTIEDVPPRYRDAVKRYFSTEE